ncbi:hypothetical protein NT6N_11010 [Oceaniferula spumae]|uniref:Uncharacterized protein n=1 Tax=Oceaniferula spumae TaxID=2979115 RepID=A0AAT9FJC8_9BACT
MALNEPWSIKSRAHACSVTEKKFVDGEAFYTALFPDPESSGYLRKDFSKEAWEKRTDEDQSPFSFWGSIYHAPVKEEEVEVTEESPEDLLRRLGEEDEEHTENVRYILAVMLERKKLLVEADSQPTPTGIIRIYEHRKTGDVFIVKDPNIPLSEIDSIQQEISDLLESGGRKVEETQESEDGDQESSEENAENAEVSDDDNAGEETPAETSAPADEATEEATPDDETNPADEEPRDS